MTRHNDPLWQHHDTSFDVCVMSARLFILCHQARNKIRPLNIEISYYSWKLFLNGNKRNNNWRNRAKIAYKTMHQKRQQVKQMILQCVEWIYLFVKPACLQKFQNVISSFSWRIARGVLSVNPTKAASTDIHSIC